MTKLTVTVCPPCPEFAACCCHCRVSASTRDSYQQLLLRAQVKGANGSWEGEVMRCAVAELPVRAVDDDDDDDDIEIWGRQVCVISMHYEWGQILNSKFSKRDILAL